LGLLVLFVVLTTLLGVFCREMCWCCRNILQFTTKLLFSDDASSRLLFLWTN